MGHVQLLDDDGEGGEDAAKGFSAVPERWAALGEPEGGKPKGKSRDGESAAPKKKSSQKNARKPDSRMPPGAPDPRAPMGAPVESTSKPTRDDGTQLEVALDPPP